MSIVQTTDAASFANDFPNRPFALRHTLAQHPLLTLPRIIELVRELPGDRIEYNSGKAAISQDPNAVPLVDLDPEEVVRRIETCGAWMVLKRVETHPAYKALTDEVLLSIARQRGFACLEDAGFEDIQAFLFVSSPNSTTPFHADSDENIFFQIRGEKLFYVYDNEDRAIASEEALEDVVAKHRNLPYDPKFDAKSTAYRLFPGDGVFVPYQWPHWVRTTDDYSISLSVTWKSQEVRRRNDLFILNAKLRSFGLPQQPPGRQPALDAVKIAAFRSVAALVGPLRKSETMRRVLRKIALGRNANYYYRDGDKDRAKAA